MKNKTPATASRPRFSLVRNSHSIRGVATILFILFASAADLSALTLKPGEDLGKAVANCKPGETVTLEAGVFTGSVALPKGVSLKGAGYDKTIIDAKDLEVGVSVDGGEGCSISDLAIRGAGKTDLSVNGASKIVVSRVWLSGAVNGAIFDKVSSGRLENVLATGNMFGLIINGGSGNVVVNCTLANNASAGLNLPAGDKTTAFNNCITGSAIGSIVGAAAKGLTLDYNCYSSLYIGKFEGQNPRKSVGYWNSLTGLDEHSVQQNVAVSDAAKNDFHPVNALTWALDRVTTADWGIAKLADIKAPDTDIDGKPRRGFPDAGAFESEVKAPRPADGTFAIGDTSGVTSAGVFTAEGREVCYLFQNLPLRKGTYSYWLPSRDFQGKPIPAGKFELRIANAALAMEYLGMVGNTGHTTPVGGSAPVMNARVGFDAKGNVIPGCDGWAENFVNLRGYDGPTGKFMWTFRSPADVKGIASGKDGFVYVLRESGDKQRVMRLDGSTGIITPWPSLKKGSCSFTIGKDCATGIAEANGILMVTDKNGKVWFGNTDNPEFKRSVDLPKPAWPAGDQSTGMFWLLSDNNVIAMDAKGTVKATLTPVEEPACMGAANGIVAIASRKDGKIHVFDARDGVTLKPLRTIGRGDGPAGQIEPDRFTFQGSKDHVCMAVGPQGQIAVGDSRRLLVFDPDGKALWSTYGVFGNATCPSYADLERRYDMDTRWSLRLDESKGTWKPEGFWELGKFSQPANVVGEFSLGGKTFAMYVVLNEKFRPNQGVGIALVDNAHFKHVALMEIVNKDNKWIVRKDTNGDGKIDDTDKDEPFGQYPNLFYSWFRPQPNGDILILQEGQNLFARLPCAGLGPDGIPSYKADARILVPAEKNMISPHTFTEEKLSRFAYFEPLPDGSAVGAMYLGTSTGGGGIFNGVGTDLVGVDANGKMRWANLLPQHQGIMGSSVVGPLVVTSVGTSAELLAFNTDGLGLGCFGLPKAAHYNGYWIDHPTALQVYRGKDGRTYGLLSDNYNGAQHWFRILGADKITATKQEFAVSDKLAAELAALPSSVPGKINVRPAPPTLTVRKLDKPLPIDGDPAKWRKLGIVPQIIITPDTATGPITGPRYASAVVRMAYEGKNLYFQILRFKDAPFMVEQPVPAHYMQDCVEMAINGFGPGFKFDIARTSDAGDIIIRQRFAAGNLEKLLDKQKAPRCIVLRDSAADISERGLIEAIYGIDMSDCRVMITEFMLPMDADTYSGTEKDMVEVAPGKTFRLGFMVDDNHTYGADLQDFMVWPATYATFNPPEDGALAVFE